MDETLNISKPVGPDDLRPGQYVVILHQVVELVSPRCGGEAWDRPRPICIELLPFEDVGVPLLVVEVCVPFVLVRQADGRHRTLDVRRHKLALVSERYGRRAFKRLRTAAAKPGDGEASGA